VKPWLAVVGLGEDGLEGLRPAARGLIAEAELLVGGERHLAMVPPNGAARKGWATPLRDTVEEILGWRGRRVVVLATGDPMWFGVGATLARAVPREELLILPGVSAFSLACARLAWPLPDVECLTLHGRPLSLLNAVAPGARLLLLSHDGATPTAVAARLRDLGYRDSCMVVLEHMGGTAERIIEGTAADWPSERCADLNTIAVECRAGPGALPRSRLAGLPDDAFRHDGQITKREVRAATLAALGPLPGERLWDVGAGCGSVAIEWLRAGRDLRAVAIERDAARRAMIVENAEALGVPQLEVVAGEAPGALAGLETPQAVFVGGGLAAPGLLDACWAALSPGGRLVANAVTVEGEARLLAFRAEKGGELTRIAVSRADSVGGFTGWRPLMPVTQLAAVKR
jgi:precorrin-6Y C5,15-methyltransferase (decarboxylating)